MSLDHAAKPAASDQARRTGFTFSQHMNELSLFFAIVVLYVIFSATAPGFMSFNNQVNILRDAATIGIAAWAVTLIIIAGEIDVSVGPMVAFTSVILAFLLQMGIPTPVAFVLAIALGALLGAIPGILRAYFDVPSFVGTLGMWSALRGTALFVTDALPVSIGRNDTLDALDRSIFGIPPAAIIMLVLFAVFAFVSRKTAFGRSVFAIGGNAHAAFLSGISVARIRVALFAIGGAMAAISGILLVSRLGSGNATAASGLEFDVIAAVVVGGTALSGGRGSMLGTLLGVLVITLIGNGLVLLGINPFFQQVVRGLIIVIAVLANIQAIKRSLARNKG
jgi:simple sugar transport system permease protein